MAPPPLPQVPVPLSLLEPLFDDVPSGSQPASSLPPDMGYLWSDPLSTDSFDWMSDPLLGSLFAEEMLPPALPAGSPVHQPPVPSTAATTTDLSLTDQDLELLGSILPQQEGDDGPFLVQGSPPPQEANPSSSFGLGGLLRWRWPRQGD